jgi:hypothetical protein
MGGVKLPFDWELQPFYSILHILVNKVNYPLKYVIGHPPVRPAACIGFAGDSGADDP